MTDQQSNNAALARSLLLSANQRIMADRDPNLESNNESNLQPLLFSLTIPELMLLFGIPDKAKASEVMEKYVDPFIVKYNPSPPDRTVLKDAGAWIQNYIMKVEDEAVDDEPEQENATQEQLKLSDMDKEGQLYNWLHYEALAQRDPTQSSRYVRRLGTVEVADADTAGTHTIMKRNQIGVNQNANVPVVQGTMNPTLRNTVSQVMTVDSAHRQTVMVDDEAITADPNGIASPTNYLINFAQPLTEVLSYTLNSVTIPYTFYNVDPAQGNNFLYVDDGTDVSLVCISGGNYDAQKLADKMDSVLTPWSVTAQYDSLTHKIVFDNGSGTDVSFIFYDTDGSYIGCDAVCGNPTRADNNLGYILGFRSNVTVTKPTSSALIPAGTTVTPPMAIKLNSTQYFVLVIDDFNNNYVNMTQVIQADAKPLVTENIVPSDISYACIPGLHSTQASTAIYRPSAPRKLTNAQLYALNANSAQKLNPVVRTTAADVPYTFATLAFSTATIPMGEDIVITDALDTASRTFFGPTEIDKFRVKLIDRYGNTVNMNGNDWFFTLSVTRLYQY